MTNRSIMQELSDIRARVRHLQRKVKDVVPRPKYSYELVEVLGSLQSADTQLLDSECKLTRLFNTNKVQQ